MRERGILIAIRGHTIPDDEDDAVLLTERTTNDWWKSEPEIWRVLRGEFPDYAVFFKGDGSAIC